jgi:hypothetical protein
MAGAANGREKPLLSSIIVCCNSRLLKAGSLKDPAFLFTNILLRKLRRTGEQAYGINNLNSGGLYV